MATVGQQRPRHITLRVTSEEAQAVEILAANDSSVSAYIRRLINRDMKRRNK